MMKGSPDMTGEQIERKFGGLIVVWEYIVVYPPAVIKKQEAKNHTILRP